MARWLQQWNSTPWTWVRVRRYRLYKETKKTIDGCYAPENRGWSFAKRLCPRIFQGRFLQISYAPEDRRRSFAKRLCPCNVWAEFSYKSYPPEFPEAIYFTNNLCPKKSGAVFLKSMPPKYDDWICCINIHFG